MARVKVRSRDRASPNPNLGDLEVLYSAFGAFKQCYAHVVGLLGKFRFGLN